MAILAKTIDGRVVVAYESVDAPGYSLRVSDAPAAADGWQYYADDLTEADFAHPWVQPTGAHDAYPIGADVSHGGAIWRSVVDANVWEPGVSGWVAAADGGTPEWVQPTGAHDAYPVGAIVAHAGKNWRSLTEANVWEPGVSGWRESLLMPPSASYPAWVQPTGGHDAYQLGDRVTHAGQTWESTFANNVWEPGVFGWVVV